ncbi:MAG: AmmeMemoRadiSam system radical SAM enzyme [Vulcanimicrobiota bacterium]
MDRRDFLKHSVFIASASIVGSRLINPEKILAFESNYQPAKYFKYLEDGTVQCTLCPLMEKLAPGKTGLCRVRVSYNKKIYTTNYGLASALHKDPVEKNPVYHFKPGWNTLALATAGCNLACPACQNWEMSQTSVSRLKNFEMSPQKVVGYARQHKLKGVAYTFTEPVIFFEYCLDIAREARRYGLTNHVVTGGYVSEEPLKEMCRYIDTFSVSIKGSNDSMYGNRPNAFEAIKRSLYTIKKAGCWLEVANLVIPGYGDDTGYISGLSRWIKSNLGADTPVHFSRFFPSFKLRNVPQTPVNTLENARNIALGEGVKFVYVGNVPGHQFNNTFCPECKKTLVQRVGFKIVKNLVQKGRCSYCNAKIAGIW